MTSELPVPGGGLLAVQSLVLARHQGRDAGVSADAMRGRARSGRWQRPLRGVYAAHSGELTREAILWAALLRAGPGAVLSHLTAAERHGLTDEPSPVITITVPASRHPAQVKIPGLVVHRSGLIARATHPAMLPPCTRVEDTVLDLVQAASSFDDAYSWVCRALGRRRTTADRIGQAMSQRKKLRWRADLTAALGDAPGALSWLEYRYARRVERAHRLPSSRRQARVRHGTGSWYLDNLYPEYGLCTELDGSAAHPAEEQWRDKRRDNLNAARGIVTLRFGYLDLRGQRCCETAAVVAAVLGQRGWPGSPSPCASPGCPVRPVS